VTPASKFSTSCASAASATRLGDIEWFDAAYRVYLVALFGGGTVLWISSSIKDTDGRADTLPTSPRTGRR
jgi:hypothetical protein